MPCVRTVKTKSDGTAVRVVGSSRRETGDQYLGSEHDEAELEDRAAGDVNLRRGLVCAGLCMCRESWGRGRQASP